MSRTCARCGRATQSPMRASCTSCTAPRWCSTRGDDIRSTSHRPGRRCSSSRARSPTACCSRPVLRWHPARAVSNSRRQASLPRDAIPQRCENAPSSTATSRATARPPGRRCCASWHSCSAAAVTPTTSNRRTSISTTRRSCRRMPATISIAPCGCCRWRPPTSSPPPGRRRNAGPGWKSISRSASMSPSSRSRGAATSASSRSTSSATLRDGRASMSTLLQMRDVRLVYGRRRPTLAIEGLDLEIDQGKFVAVVGPSGCGKSSLMKLVTGLRRPSAGSIEVAGKEVNGPLKIVGMAFQNPTLLPWRTTLSNVMLPLEIVEPHRHQFRRERTRYRQQANALLNLVGLENFGEKYPWQLSGGMQQRASLCRSLIHEPALLMLDEPFGALDAFTREELWDVLQELWMRRGFTTILVTHDLREAVYLADTVHVMSSRPGRIIAPHDVPIERPRRPRTAYEPRFMDIVARIREEIRGERNEQPPARAHA